jgi:hypothetical protein
MGRPATPLFSNMEVWHTGEGALGTTKEKLDSEKEKLMTPKCRHIMPGGGQCHGYAIQGGNLCYFHRRQRIAAQKPVSMMDSIEIPLLEDRCAIQVTLSQVLRHIVNKTIDRPRASLLLYGLQLSLQSVDRSSWAIPIGTVKALHHTRDGKDLAVDPDDDYEDDEEGEDSDDSGGEDDENSRDGSVKEKVEDDADDGDDDDDEFAGETTEELIAGQKYLQSVSNALEVGDMRLAARLLKESSP